MYSTASIQWLSVIQDNLCALVYILYNVACTDIPLVCSVQTGISRWQSSQKISFITRIFGEGKLYYGTQRSKAWVTTLIGIMASCSGIPQLPAVHLHSSTILPCTSINKLSIACNGIPHLHGVHWYSSATWRALVFLNFLQSYNLACTCVLHYLSYTLSCSTTVYLACMHYRSSMTSRALLQRSWIPNFMFTLVHTLAPPPRVLTDSPLFPPTPLPPLNEPFLKI